MKRRRVLISLATLNSDYEIEQACAAHEKASRLGLDLQLVYAENDPVTQSQQLLLAIQSPKESRPEAIIVEPAGGTGLLRVAHAAAEARIGWVVINWDDSYVEDLRQYPVPAFSVSTDHKEIGRIQGRQIAVLLPRGGSALYIQGPSHSPRAQQRSQAMQETMPATVEVKILKANWTHQSAQRAVKSWLRLSSLHTAPIHVVVAQNDAMALGAREAFRDAYDADRWRCLRFLGCDGLPNAGQAWVRRGYMAATVVIPLSIALAMELLVGEFQGGTRLPPRTLTVPEGYPSLEELGSLERCRADAKSSRQAKDSRSTLLEMRNR